MRIAVLGAGAMGSWFGGQLSLHGNDVQLLTTNADHRNAITQKGLILRQSSGDQVVSVPAYAPESIVGPVDLVLLFTKAFQSSDAMASIAPAIDKDTHVLSLQNGLGNAESIATLLPMEHIWIGVSMIPVDKIAAGIVSNKGHGKSFFGNATGTNDSKMVKRLLTAFASTGLELEHVNNVHQRIWEKVAFNSGMNALAALSHGRPGTIGTSPGAREMVRDVAVEVAAVAEARNIEVNIENVNAMIELSTSKHGDHIPSMLQDLLASKRTEVDALNGAIVNFAEQSGVPVPLNRVLTTLVRLAEVSHQTYSV